MALPIGLVYDPADKVVLDPDVGVHDAVAHLHTDPLNITIEKLAEATPTQRQAFQQA